MPVIKYRVVLTNVERKRLITITSKGSSTAKMIMHAHVLLFADEHDGRKLSEKEIASRLSVHFQTVHSIRKTYALFGLDVALGRKKRSTPPITPKITGDVEAKIIALSCSSPPEGRNRWTLRLLADKVVELRILESISHETIHRTLKKTN